MNKQINTTKFIGRLDKNKRVGFCIDDDKTTWINLDFIGPKFITYLNASFDGCEIIRIGNDLFAPEKWARDELAKTFKGEQQALATVKAFFKTLDANREKVRSVYHA
jgi:hypothetical protein